MNALLTRARVAAGAAVLLAFLIVPLAFAGSGSSPESTASGAGKKIKKLTKRVAALEQQIASLTGEQGGARPPNGPAGGDLTGSYPNPLVGPNAIGSAEVQANSLTADDLNTDSVEADEIATSAVGSDEIGDGSVTGTDVQNSSLTGTDVLNGSLSDLDTDASVQDSCTNGAVKGYALVDGAAGFGSTYTATGVAERFACAGALPTARRVGAGDYRVCFPGLQPGVALVSSIDPSAGGADNIVSWGRVVDAACGSVGNLAMQVQIIDRNAGAAEDRSFSVALVG